MTDFEDPVQELAEQIRSLDEYEEFINARDKVEDDSDAQEVLADLRRVENELQQAHAEDEPHEEHEELHDEYHELQEQFTNMSVVVKYHEAAEALEEQLREVNALLSDEIDMNFAESVAFE